MIKRYLYIGGILAAIILSLSFGWYLWHPAAPKPETYAPAEKLADGAVMLERSPRPTAKPAHALPAGGKLERAIRLEVRSKPVVNQAGADTKTVDCPPVQVDLSVVKMPDESRRVVASSPNGEVMSGIDIPVEAAKPLPSPLKWAAGLTANPIDRTYGVFIDRDIGPFRIGGEVNQINGGLDFRIKAGIRF